MYLELENNYTKTRYSQILDETKRIAEHKLSGNQQDEDIAMWISIKAQIEDIRKNIVESQVLHDWEEIYERYSIGTIGLDCFDENDEMYMRLCDIFHGAVHYHELKDK